LGQEVAMTAHALKFASLSDSDRRRVDNLAKLDEAEVIEVHVRLKSGEEQIVILPAEAVAVVGAALGGLARGERVAVLSEGEEVTPNQASEILGISRPLVVHRMEIGDLPFRYVGKHRRARLADVLALQARLEEQRAALRALAEDAEDLAGTYGV
jgi:hypothetical protein